MNICKYCKVELDPTNTLPYKAVKMDKRGYYYVCQTNLNHHHEPMDNLDYIEWVAKQRGLVV